MEHDISIKNRILETELKEKEAPRKLKESSSYDSVKRSHTVKQCLARLLFAANSDNKRERKEATSSRATNPSTTICRTSSRVEDDGGNYQHSRGRDSYASRRVEISRGKGILREWNWVCHASVPAGSPARSNTRYLASRRRLTSSRMHQGAR